MTKLHGLVLLAVLVLTIPATAGGKASVRTITDIPYNEAKDAHKNHKLNLYLPKGKKKAPVIFFVHGGGWRKGDRSNLARVGKVFAANGIAFVSTGYRLTPQVKHPEHIKDVAMAFAWTKNNIAKYGGDPNNIFVSGHSAGGHLCALLATNGQYLKRHGVELSAIRGAMPISGVYFIGPSKGFTPVFGNDAEGLKSASPISHVSKDNPPFLILYAEKDIKGFDKLADRFGASLKKAGVEASVHELTDRNHGSIVFAISGADDPTAELILNFVKKHTK